MIRLWHRLRARIRYRRFDADLHDELAYHREMKAAELSRGGSPAADTDADGAAVDISAATAREMGNVTLAREAARAVWIAPWIDSLRQDLTYAARSLRRQPAFTIAALAALILAMGLNTSLFTAFNALALRPWNVADPWRLVTIFDLRANGELSGGFSLAEYRYFRDHSRTLSGLFAKRDTLVPIGEDDTAKRGWVSLVSSSYFDVLGATTLIGRAFVADDDRLGAPAAVAVISYGLWQDRFGSDPAVLGRNMRVNNAMFTIVGVMPNGFRLTPLDRTAVWIPLATMPLVDNDPAFARMLLERPSACCTGIAGRLARGVTRQQAQAELDQLSAAFRQSVGQQPSHPVLRGTQVLAQNKDNKPTALFTLMFAASTLVLLLACANVGNLLLARALARQREIAVRLSLGAGRARVIRQLLTESLLLALIAGVIGISVAFVLPDFLGRAAFGPGFDAGFRPDGWLVAFTAGLCLLACLLFGAAPAMRGTRVGIAALASGPGLTGTTRALGTGFSLRSLLLAMQLTISLILLVGAVLLTRSARQLAAQDPGFAVDDVLVATVQMPVRAYDKPRTAAFVRDLAAAVRNHPDLGHPALTLYEPLANGRNITGVRLPGEVDSRTRPIQEQLVSPEYFDVLRIPLLAGRPFVAADAGQDVALVNQTMARELWPDQNPIGRTILGANPRGLEIVGVVHDAYTSGLDRLEPTLYRPLAVDVPPRILLKLRRGSPASGPASSSARDPVNGTATAARATTDTTNTTDTTAAAAASTAAIRALVHGLDSRVDVTVEPLRAALDRWLATSRTGAAMAAGVALLALVLAAVGVFGVFAFLVQARTPEIGLRMAIGAQPHQVVAFVLRSTAGATLGGFAMGLLGSVASARLLTGMLSGVSPFDPPAYAIASATLLLAAGIATYIPARRATRIDPIMALRRE